MEILQLKGPQISFEVNKKLQLAKNIMLISYVVLETLYKTLFGKYLAVEMERVQCVVGAVLALLLLIEWFRLDKDNKINWIKRHSIVFVYFVIRILTFVNIGLQYTMLRSVFFEGIYLLVLTELILDSKFCRNIVFKFFIIANLLLNIFNTFIYLYCDYVDSLGETTSNFLYNFFNEYTHVSDFMWFNHCSMYSNPNQIGLMTGLAVLISLNYITKNMSLVKKVVAGVYFAFSLYCMIYSNCNSSYVAFVMVAVAFILTKKAGVFSNKKIIVICLICCILAVALVYVIIAVGDELTYTEFETKLDTVSAKRYTIWKDSYYSHQDELLLGCGNMTLEKRDRYQYNLDKGNDLGLDINGSLIDYFGSHNGYIGMISCAGLLGFAAFIALTLKKIQDSNSLNKKYWYLSIIYILIINFFECMVPISKNFITLYMFLILAMDDREEII